MRRAAFPFLLFVMIAFSGLLPGQAAKARRKPADPAKAAEKAPEAYPLESIAISGRQRYKQDAVIAATGLKVGQRVGKQDFEAARERLLATGDFDDVAYEYKPSANLNGYSATFQIKEVPTQYVIRYESLPVAANELNAALKQRDPLFTGGVSASPIAIARYTQLVKDVLTEKGKSAAIISKVTPEPGAETFIVFRPEGALPSISQVKFRGNKILTEKDLQTAVAGSAIGVTFTEKRMQEILDAAVRPLYEARGYLRVRFPKIEEAPDPQVKGLILTVNVVEGDIYKIGRVSLAGRVDDPSILLRESGIKEGVTANFDDVKAGIGKMEDSMKKEGYLAVESSVDRKVNNAAHTVDLTITLKPGYQYHFGKLEIAGLDILSEPQIRKLWAMKEGAPFNPNYPDYFLSRLRSDGVFDNLGKTNSEIHRDDEKHIADVTLYFRGAEQPDSEKRRRRRSSQP